MPRVARPIAIFALLYLAAGSVLYSSLPQLMAWHFANCTEPSAMCSVSSTFLSYWWVALLPALIIITLLINQVLAKRHAA
jgi:uncharacterized membrane protein